MPKFDLSEETYEGNFYTFQYQYRQARRNTITHIVDLRLLRGWHNRAVGCRDYVLSEGGPVFIFLNLITDVSFSL